ncbi:MAG: flagellar assembly protein FliH [Hahellaceae bacterium]|nr:flagellar assembly protein FliH [Hahellaceae bacterium]
MPPDHKSPPETPPETLTAYERWELPVMGDSGSASRTAEGAAKPSAAKAAPGPQKPVKPPTAAELEAIREAAYKEGLDQGRHDGLKLGRESGLAKGLEEGRKQGMAEGQKKGQELAFKTHGDKITRQLQHLEQTIQALAKPLEQDRQAIEEALLRLVQSVAKAVTYRELTLPSETILAVIQGALALLPENEGLLKITLHPDDLEFIRSHSGGVDKSWHLLADAQIAAGGCKVESRHSVIDFTREKRFQQVIDQLLARKVDEAAAEAHRREAEVLAAGRESVTDQDDASEPADASSPEANHDG